MLPGSFLINWRIGSGDRARIELLSLPDKVLQQIAFILGQQQKLRLIDHLLEICDERPSFLGKLFRGVRQRLRGQKAVESDVNLVVLE